MKFSVNPRTTGSLEVAGAEIAYASWGPDDGPPVVLVHGAGAQMGWWDAVIKELGGHRVIALDLSGNGDSGWREQYTGELWAQETLEIAERVAGARVVLVGHSLGGGWR